MFNYIESFKGLQPKTARKPWNFALGSKRTSIMKWMNDLSQRSTGFNQNKKRSLPDSESRGHHGQSDQ